MDYIYLFDLDPEHFRFNYNNQSVSCACSGQTLLEQLKELSLLWTEEREIRLAERRKISQSCLNHQKVGLS